jgi:phosphatidylglycerophosphate synthase
MLDRTLRPAKDAVLQPLAATVPSRVPVLAITAAAAVAGLAAAAAAAVGLALASLALWLAGRALDGLDGAVARARGATSELGGYLDLVLDVAVYAAVPLGIAAHLDTRSAWIAATALLATFYVNAVAWTLLSAILERRGRGAAAEGEQTVVTMPRGLVEGTETVVLLGLALAVPSWAVAVFWVMAAGVLVSVLQRVVWAARTLERPA